MSTVGISKDQFQQNRGISLAQERLIAKDRFALNWKQGDLSKTLPVEKLIGILFSGIFAFWVFLLTLFSVGIMLVFGLAKLFSNLVADHEIRLSK
jgi:hypothetical protein